MDRPGTCVRLRSIRVVAAAVACLLAAGPAEAGPARNLAEFARRTLQFVERSAPRPALAAELAALEKRSADAQGQREVDEAASAAGAKPAVSQQ